MNKQIVGYDFNGVLSTGLQPEQNFIVLTGRDKSENDEINETLEECKFKYKIFNFPGDEEMTDENKDVKVGIWKSKKIKELGIQKFYEDTQNQIDIIKEMNPDVDIFRILDGIPQEKLNFVIFYHSNTPIVSIAQKLEKEGNRVILGVIEDSSKVLLPKEVDNPENPKEKKLRLSIGDGLIEKYNADEVLKMMKKVKNKNEWIVLTDSNSNYQYAEKMLEYGFTKGFFPLQIDREFESERKKAKDFVKENYPEIKVAEVKTFKEVSEGIEFLNNDEEGLWVLKSLGDAGTTVCPNTEDCEIAKQEIISALEEMKKDYEENGFLLEPRILEPIEITPQIIFNDGTPIFTDLDLEIKTIAEGSAVQTGCMLMLNIKTEIEDRINKIAFPKIVHDMARDRKGLFVWDLSILIDKKGDMYFGEFCSMRMGYDSWLVELAMSADDEGSKNVTPFFSALMYKKNPLRKKYGVGVRLLNIGNGGKMVEDGTIEVSGECENNVFLFENKIKKDKKVSTTYCYDLGVVVGASDELYHAIKHAYEAVDKVMFEGKFFRTQHDFESYSYPASIMRRFDYVMQNGLISDEDKSELNDTVGRTNY